MSKKRFDNAKNRLRRLTWQSGLTWCKHENAKYHVLGRFKPRTAIVKCACGYQEIWTQP